LGIAAQWLTSFLDAKEGVMGHCAIVLFPTFYEQKCLCFHDVAYVVVVCCGVFAVQPPKGKQLMHSDSNFQAWFALLLALGVCTPLWDVSYVPLSGKAMKAGEGCLSRYSGRRGVFVARPMQAALSQ
jgi:hypothetical protein